jgi:hypothetical protein
MLKKAILSAGLIAAAGMLAGVNCATASVQTFSGYSPASGINASTITFTFDTSNNQLEVNIQNTSASVGNIGQAISGISFSLSGFSGSLSVDPSAAVGYEGNTTPYLTGVPSLPKLLSNSELNNPWEMAGTGGTFALGNPKITPGLSAGKRYPKGSPTDLVVETISGANGSIGAHEPSLFGTGTNGADGVTFTLDATGGSITTSTAVIGNVAVYFGTGPDYRAYDGPPGTPVPAGGPLPIPATLPLVGGGLLGLAALAMRRRRAL